MSHIRARPRTRLTALSFCAVLICILAFSSSEISEAQGNVIDPGSAPSAGVRCWTESSATEVLPFETLLAAIYLMNESDQPRTVTEEWDVFQFVLGENGKRTYYYPAGEPISPPSPVHSIVLNPREVKTWITYFDFDFHPVKHVFTHPGIVRVATSLGSTRCGSMTISVAQPQGQDARAYDFLKQTDLVHYLANRAPDRWYQYNYQTVARLEAFIQQFPDSRYKDYAELNLALMWKQGVEGKVDLAKATDLLTDLSKHGHDAMPARALYYLGEVAQQEGDVVRAKSYYQRAIEGKPDPYFRYIGEDKVRHLSAERKDHQHGH